MSGSDDELRAHLQQLETRLADRATRQSPERLELLLAHDFCEFGSSGTKYNKAEIVAALMSEEPGSDIAISDFELKFSSAECALVTYRATRVDAESGGCVESLRSSVWVLQDGRWQVLFHQGTRVPVK